MKQLISILLCLACTSPSATVLGSGGVLYMGQTIMSDTSKYRLVQQGDGNLVFYRNSDNAVRFATFRAGTHTAMQTDGNLVQYAGSGSPLWYTGTQGNPGSYLSVQDDGNLVVYSAAGAPLWNIGADQAPVDGPTHVADVVGRALDYPGLGPLGHVGIWTGSQVIEVVGGASNAVRLVSWDAFRSTSEVWPTAHPAVPNHTVYQCFTTFCGGGSFQNVAARLAVVQRANQVRLIGADYTTFSHFYSAWPAEPGYPAQRGVYLCDTFVGEAFQYSIYGAANAPAAWVERMHALLGGLVTPTAVWNRLKN
jgi:hypothetical protein